MIPVLIKNMLSPYSDDENEKNDGAPVSYPTSSEKRNVTKSKRSYLDAYPNGEINKKMDDIEHFVEYKHLNCHLRQYSACNTPLVIEWARVRIPNKAWMYLRAKKSDFRLKWIPISNGKQRTPSVLCRDYRL
ncbi:hypothetical protein TNCV_2148591 [Trichonephila clavipes]|uniref:Uncharacterized protein n=1 Tax=Trichonephila clavipes TaxID=2585209 RepID=A0A8X6T4R3_TRICX|nr:hypothetical protein TNCV_2148591 [Trichonephila clavipes]